MILWTGSFRFILLKKSYQLSNCPLAKSFDMEKCLYDRWFDNEVKNLNRFTVTLFQAYQYADGTNKAKIKSAWPEWFTNSEY